MSLPGKKVSNLPCVTRVRYVASYLIFTTVYMGDIVNSYFTEDETRVPMSGRLPKGHPCSKWQR